jgi:hypothetical protein
VFPDERFELGNELRCPTEGELGIDAILDRGESRLLEPSDVALGE